MKKIVFIVTILTVTISLAYALLPYNGKPIPYQPRDYVKPLPDIKKLQLLGYTAEQIYKERGTIGTKKVAFILVYFPSAGASTSGQPTIKDFSAINTKIQDFVTFYKEASFNLLNISAHVFPSATTAYLLNNSMEYYGTPDINISTNSYNLIHDALDMTGIPGVTKAHYDAVMIVHAGYGQESSRKEGDIHSLHLCWTDIDSRGYTEASIVPELETGSLSSFGVFCHEFGHELGLPDLYNTSTDLTEVGKWCLMDAGAWSGDGENPSHPSAWCKKFLGWLQVETITTSGSTKSVYPIETSTTNALYKIPVETGGSQEYFLIEYRWRGASGTYDKDIPGDGLVIWHIDDEIASDSGRIKSNNINTGIPHLGIDLVEQDSSKPIAPTYGEASDVFVDGQDFLPPKSNAFNNNPSGISIVSISGAGSDFMNFTLYRYSLTNTVTIAKVISYPNPTYDGKATIQLVFTRPPTELYLDIYNIAGEKVISVPKEQMNIAGAKMADYQWVYEYTWQGKNNSNEDVCSGVYFYCIKADKETKTEKLVIIR